MLARRTLEMAERAFMTLFDHHAEKQYPWLTWGWLAALYLLGAAAWGKFLNWGRIPFDFHDWAEVWAPRIAFVRDAVLKGALPLHMQDTSALRGVTDRFLALPDMMITPQMLLMAFMDVGMFILVNTLILYTLGGLGLLWIRRRFSLSLFSFSVLFLLFNLNGHILSHYSIGHVSWAGYFLLPLVMVLTFRLLDGDASWAWVTQFSLLNFFIFLQGAFHPFVWILMFLGLLAVTSWKRFVPLLKVLVASCLLSMVRILPVTLLLGAFDTDYLGGYVSLWDVWRAMVELVEPAHSLDGRNMLTTLGWWELDLYMGLLGALFLLYFGVFRWIKRVYHSATVQIGWPVYGELFLPVMGMVLLSIGRVYGLLRLLPVPLLSGERVSSRMIILPVAFLLVFAAAEMQRWMASRPHTASFGILWLGGLVLLAHDLWQHLKLWQVTNAFTAFPLTPRDLSIVAVSNHADPPYFAMLGIGAAVSLISLLVLLVLWRRERRSVAP